jgi:hypothetical protein
MEEVDDPHDEGGPVHNSVPPSSDEPNNIDIDRHSPSINQQHDVKSEDPVDNHMTDIPGWSHDLPTNDSTPIDTGGIRNDQFILFKFQDEDTGKWSWYMGVVEALPTHDDLAFKVQPYRSTDSDKELPDACFVPVWWDKRAGKEVWKKTPRKADEIFWVPVKPDEVLLISSEPVLSRLTPEFVHFLSTHGVPITAGTQAKTNKTKRPRKRHKRL